jgi:aminopeptidase N
MRRVAAIILLFAGFSIHAAPGPDRYVREPAVDAINYRIEVEIADAGDRISGVTEILLEIKENGVKEVILDFAELTIDAVHDGDHPAKHDRNGDRLTVQLAAPRQAGEQCRLRISYHGSPKDGLFIKPNKYGDRAAFADNWPNRAHQWFPAIDHPYDKATAEYLITAPQRFDVIANGSLVEKVDRGNGMRLTHWRENVPIPTYCMVIGAAEFAIIEAGNWHGVPLSYYVYPKDKPDAAKEFGRALQILQFDSELIGPFPYEKLALVESSTRFGGMENASAIFFDEKALNGKRTIEPTVAHEIAHQWFGDSVTESDWHHLWLSEGFATYFGHLFYEHADGHDRFIAFMLADKQAYLTSNASKPRPIYDPDISNLFELLNANNYQKAGWMLHMLRHVMGDTAFFAGIRDYYQKYRDRNALTADFEDVMEHRYGRKLDWFFREWFYGTGHPVYDATWHWNDAARELRLRMIQKQDALFQMPLDVEFSVNHAIRRETVDAAQRDQTFTFKLDHKPERVSLDPGEWVLKVATLKED